MGDLIGRFMPSLRMCLTVTPVAALYAGLVFTLVGHLRVRRQLRIGYTRKILHFLTFTTAGLIHLVWGLRGVVVFGSVVAAFVLYAVWRGDGHPWYEAIARPSDAPRRTLFVVVPLIMTTLGGAVTNVFFLEFAYVGYLVCGWGDAVGEPVGTRWGKHPYQVPSLSGVPATRTLEGSAAVFLVGSVAAVLGLLANGYDPIRATWLGFACGAAGAIVEAFSNHGIDNFTTQVAASAVASLLG